MLNNEIANTNFFKNGQEALEYIKMVFKIELSKHVRSPVPVAMRPIKVLILDYQMPKMSGDQVIE